MGGFNWNPFELNSKISAMKLSYFWARANIEREEVHWLFRNSGGHKLELKNIYVKTPTLLPKSPLSNWCRLDY